MRSESKAIDREVGLLMQLFEVAAHHVAHLDVLEMVPTAFIPRVIVHPGFCKFPARLGGDSA